MSCTQMNVMGYQLNIQSPDRFESRTRRNNMGKFVDGETFGALWLSLCWRPEKKQVIV
jgi:hypothetical protein